MRPCESSAIAHRARPSVEQGGLISYSVNNRENFRRAAAFISKIITGTKPGDLPIELPTKMELVVNLKTGKALGITIPPTLLVRADDEAAQGEIANLGPDVRWDCVLKHRDGEQE
jgi:ABC-type uncharacterized transport system substrate-binding protein